LSLAILVFDFFKLVNLQEEPVARVVGTYKKGPGPIGHTRPL